MRAESSSRLTCIDAFSGAGGMRLGLQWAGIDVISAFDLDPKCVATQNVNTAWFVPPAEQADIRDLLHGNLLRKTRLEPGQLFLLSGGPPCQGFSIQRIGPNEDVRDELVLAYSELIGELMPRYFLMENVPGILGARGKNYTAVLLGGVRRIGYSVSIKTLNAADYGVPQRRKRVIVIGVRGIDTDLNDVFPVPSTPEGSRITVREAIGMLPPPPDDPSDEPTIPNHVRDRLSPLNLRRLAAVRPGEGRSSLPPELLAACHLRPADEIGHRNVYGRMEWDKVAPTITARFDSFTRGQFGHPDQLRSISLREGALLQTFPIDFRFSGTKVEVARQIGNAVPPLFARALGEAIVTHYRKSSAGS